MAILDMRMNLSLALLCQEYLKVVEYELFHDESKEEGFWHGMLLVPTVHKEKLVKYLTQSREYLNYDAPIGIKKVKKYGRIFNLARSWVHIGVAAMASSIKGAPIPYYTGKREDGDNSKDIFPDLIGTKFIIFLERDSFTKMSGSLDYGGKFETTFRMGFKGGLHFFGSDEEPIHIKKMHFDGHEHYQRRINRNRIINRLYGLRDYCKVANKKDLINDNSSDHTKKNCQAYADCQLLQLTDLMIGCFRSILGKPTKDIHIELAQPVRAIVERYKEGYARMQNSKWRNSFCISQCYLDDSDRWKFEPIQFEVSNDNYQQPTLF